MRSTILQLAFEYLFWPGEGLAANPDVSRKKKGVDDEWWVLRKNLVFDAYLYMF